MATETTTPNVSRADAPLSGPPGPALGRRRWAGYANILWARTLELKREPEVIFWVFVFPLLLAFGLGIAFRNKPADTTSVAIVAGDEAEKTLAMLQASPAHASIRAAILDRESALNGFRFGKFDLVVETNPDQSYTYRYDPARPESVLSRAEIDSALQAAAGRKDAIEVS